MYFALTALAAVLSTVLWIKSSRRSELKLGTLCLIYWGATIMWAVDLVIAFREEGLAAFETGSSATLLGVLVVALGVLIWGTILVIAKRKLKVRQN